MDEMTQEEMDRRIDQAMAILDGVPYMMLDAKMTDDNTIGIKWNPIFLKYRDIFQRLGFLEDLDEVEFAVKVLESASKFEEE